MKVRDLPGWPPRPFASFNLDELTWEQMAAIVHMFWHEAKRRNPIGINMYEAAFSRLAAELEEIAGAELDNPTCEAGPQQAHKHVFDSTGIDMWVRNPACLYCTCGQFRWVEEFGMAAKDRRVLK